MVLPLNSELPSNFSPEIVDTLERAFEDVWIVLQAHLEPGGSEKDDELAITLSRMLVALAADGITDRQELRRRALVTVALTPR